mgnify:CR=1 FL=1
MRELLEQVELTAADHRLFYSALMGGLSIPDIAGALAHPSGEAKRPRYIEWFDEWAAPEFTHPRTREVWLTGSSCYGFRCSFLHQGRLTRNDLQLRFYEPRPPGFTPGDGELAFGGHMNRIGPNGLQIDIQRFSTSVVMAARRWMATVEGTDPYENNLARFVRRHPGGWYG